MTTHLNEKEIIPLHNKKNHNGSNNVKKASWFFAFLLMSILNNKGALAISKESLKPVDVKNLIYTSDSYSQKNVTIDDIYLEKSKKQYFFDLFTMIKNKAEVVKAGGRVPKGIMLHGLPGLGKTSIIKALAGSHTYNEGIVLFTINKTDYATTYNAEGANRLTQILTDIKKYCDEHQKQGIIVFDEFESIVMPRNPEYPSSHDELSVLLRFLDGTTENDSVTLIGTTNMPIKYLDPAIIRSGRIDQIIELSLPNQELRKTMFKNRIEKKEKNGMKLFEKNFDFNILAKETEFFSFADIEGILTQVCNDRYLKVSKTDNKNILITQNDLITEIKRQSDIKFQNNLNNYGTKTKYDISEKKHKS